MDALSLILLIISILSSAGRNIFSKYISSYSFGEKRFFLSQAIIFSTGSFISLIFGKISFPNIAPITFIYAFIYGTLLLCAQWCYTVALKRGKTGICSTVYSLGFIFPTLSGAIFWSEKLTVFNILGILIVIPTIILSGRKKGSEGMNIGAYLAPLLIAMLASGGLGIMQKVQQSSAYANQKDAFIFLSFLFSAVVSFAGVLVGHKSAEQSSDKKTRLLPMLFAAGVGVCFVVCNILNTTLAGRLSSALLFPSLNIGTIFLSMLLGILFFKDKLSKNDGAILLLGCAAILLISI
ncbi:MAG: hypothetical protein E7642_07680 [Ruminococcaceae bacterium]|nr:hypothetical protein [Oscillospiraceae bacterium]